jgi:predicted nucleic acid-binding protein
MGQSDRVVVDASLAVKWGLVEGNTAESLHLLASWERGSVRRLAPGWFAAEIANVLCKGVRKQVLTVGLAQQGLRQILRAVELRLVEETIAERAIELADLLGLAATYDAQSLALAEHEGCELWTADEALWRTVTPTLPWVRWVGSVVLPPPSTTAATI